MDYILTWSHSALTDIDEIAEYIHRDSPFYASVVVEKIQNRTKELPAQPRSGRMVPEVRSDTIREVFVYDYRLIYEIAEAQQKVIMLAVLHGRRRINNTLTERLDQEE